MAALPQDLIALPAVVDLDALDAVRDALIPAIGRGPVTVSGAAVERISTNALVMLACAARTAARNDVAFAVAAPSAPLLAAVARLGFGDRFAPLLQG
jgi:hypothetical protein